MKGSQGSPTARACDVSGQSCELKFLPPLGGVVPGRQAVGAGEVGDVLPATFGRVLAPERGRAVEQRLKLDLLFGHARGLVWPQQGQAGIVGALAGEELGAESLGGRGRKLIFADRVGGVLARLGAGLASGEYDEDSEQGERAHGRRLCHRQGRSIM